jgi:hypothetical protein
MYSQVYLLEEQYQQIRTHLNKVLKGSTLIMQDTFRAIQGVVYSWILGPKRQIVDGVTHINISHTIVDLH